MSYTALRVVESGIPLYDEHERRLARAGNEAVSAFRSFASDAAVGIYRVQWTGQSLAVEPVAQSTLFDGIPVRFLPSPLSSDSALIDKRAAPNEYSSVRTPGVATLLTSGDGSEIYESCTAGVLEWGDGFIAPPADRPRLRSATIETLLRQLPVRQEPIRRDGTRPLALVNAVAGLVVPHVPGRSAFPSEARALFDRMWHTSTRRP